MANKAPIPKRADGTYDTDTVKAVFMASPIIDWTRFAEEQGWNPNRTRSDFPVKAWQEEKKRIIAENQGDILAAMIFERKYSWSQDVMRTLDRYPKVVDNVTGILEAKIADIGEMYVDYRKKKDAGQLNDPARRLEPWEKLKISEVNALGHTILALIAAKQKSNMLDKFLAIRMQVADEDLRPPDPTAQETTSGIGFTFEGKKELTPNDLQDWFDNFFDKPMVQDPSAAPQVPAPPPKTVTPTASSSETPAPTSSKSQVEAALSETGAVLTEPVG